MSIVYVTEQGARVLLQRGRLLVQRGRAILHRVRVDDVEQLAVLGHVTLTPAAVRGLLARRIDTVFLSRSGDFVGRLSAGHSKNVALRHAQHLRLEDPPFATALARACVKAKVANQRRLLQRAQRRLRDDEVAKAAVALRHVLSSLDSASSIDTLRGLEGHAAATYFGVLGRAILPEWARFTRRRRRPPPDPGNLLLSFGYTMLTNHMTGLVETAGLDPFLGALHTIDYGRPSLVLDLIEELRPLVIDTTMLEAFNRRIIQRSDFVFAGEAPDLEAEDEWSGPEQPERTLHFRREGALKWVTAVESRLETKCHYAPKNAEMSYRQIMREQVHRLARAIEGGEPYEGFVGAQ